MVDTSKTEHSALFPSKIIPKNKNKKRITESHHCEAVVAATVLLYTVTVVAIVAVAVRLSPVAVDVSLIL